MIIPFVSLVKNDETMYIYYWPPLHIGWGSCICLHDVLFSILINFPSTYNHQLCRKRIHFYRASSSCNVIRITSEQSMLCDRSRCAALHTKKNQNWAQTTQKRWFYMQSALLLLVQVFYAFSLHPASVETFKTHNFVNVHQKTKDIFN